MSNRLVSILVVLLGTASLAHAQSDTTPPNLTGFSFAPTTIDVTGESATVTCSMTLADDLSGVRTAECGFVSPDGQHVAHCITNAPISGTIFDGVWACTATVARYSPAGSWIVGQVNTSDNAVNSTAYPTAQLAQLGFPTQLTVVDAAEDVQPPALVAFGFSPDSVDTSQGPQAVTCTMGLTDAPAGVLNASCSFRSPGGAQLVNCSSGAVLVAGDLHDGVFTCTAMIPQFAEDGSWNVDRITMSDRAYNGRAYTTPDLAQLSFPTQLEVSSQQDVAPPELTGFDVVPRCINTAAGPAEVECRVSATDAPAGVHNVSCSFRSPTGAQVVNCAGSSLQSGDVHDGAWSCIAYLPRYSEQGMWTVTRVTASDGTNSRGWVTSQLASLGLPTQLEVGTACASGGDTDVQVESHRAVGRMDPAARPPGAGDGRGRRSGRGR